MKKDNQEEEKKKNEEAQDTSVTISREEYEELVKKLSEFSTLQDRLLRSAADFENAKKRLTKEREDFLKFALEDFIYNLLPILDHFELALAHLDPNDEKMKSMRDGFGLIHRQLASLLSQRSLKRIESVGKPFDPHQHESVGHIVSTKHPEGTILEEVQPGYELNGKLIRPAKVKISIHEEQPSLQEKNEELT